MAIVGREPQASSASRWVGTGQCGCLNSPISQFAPPFSTTQRVLGTTRIAKCRFLAHFAESDPWVSRSARRNMEHAISSAGCAYLAFDYPGTGHWFAEADRSEAYDAASAELAFERTITHLGSN